MPELPEVETVRRMLASAIPERRIARATVSGKKLRTSSLAALPAKLQGRVFALPRRTGKFLLLDLDGGVTLLSHLGMSGQFDELHQSVNRAAEAAVPQSISLLQSAIKSMSVQDAQGILTGGQTAATDYFRKVTSGELFTRVLPVVTKATEKVGLAQQYNALAERGASLGVVDAKQAKLEPYVTNKALDGLYLMIGEEEKKIRANPVGAATDVARRVFGAIGR